MNRRGNPFSILILILLITVVLLQVNIYKEKQRLNPDFDRLIKIQTEQGHKRNTNSKRRKTALKEEGDRPVWGLRVEPKTLNQINVDGDIYFSYGTPVTSDNVIFTYCRLLEI